MYTEKQVEEAFEGYHKRIDNVLEVIQLMPLNSFGIYHVANISKDFQSVYNIQQISNGVALSTNIENLVNVCREAILSVNPIMSADKIMLNDFVDMVFELEEKPFFFVAYDRETLNYAKKNSSLEKKFMKAEIRHTHKEVPFYLTMENDVNSKFPLRIRLA